MGTESELVAIRKRLQPGCNPVATSRKVSRAPPPLERIFRRDARVAMEDADLPTPLRLDVAAVQRALREESGRTPPTAEALYAAQRALWWRDYSPPYADLLLELFADASAAGAAAGAAADAARREAQREAEGEAEAQVVVHGVATPPRQAKRAARRRLTEHFASVMKVRKEAGGKRKGKRTGGEEAAEQAQAES